MPHARFYCEDLPAGRGAFERLRPAQEVTRMYFENFRLKVGVYSAAACGLTFATLVVAYWLLACRLRPS